MIPLEQIPVVEVKIVCELHCGVSVLAACAEANWPVAQRQARKDVDSNVLFSIALDLMQA